MRRPLKCQPTFFRNLQRAQLALPTDKNLSAGGAGCIAVWASLRNFGGAREYMYFRFSRN